MQNFDLIIVGAGNAGLTLAAGLPANLRIAVIDRQGDQKAPSSVAAPPQADGRKIALNYGSKLILDTFNLWSALLPYTTPIEQVHVSQQGYFGATRLTASANNLPALGYTIAAEQLSYVLQTKTCAQDNITWFYAAKVLALKNNTLTITQAEKEHSLTAKLIIAADGSNSTCRQLLDIETNAGNYEQAALITRVKLRTTSPNIAYQRFLRDGSLALLPMQAAYYGVVWIGNQMKMAELNSLTDAQLLMQLQKDFGYRLGRFIELDQRFTYPIRTMLAKTQSKDRCLLLGDAAHQISPIVAQGFNLTLQDIYCLVNLLQAHPNDIDLILAAYTKERLPEQRKIISSIEKLMTTFKTAHFPVPQLRSLGLTVTDLLPHNKKNMSELFMGLTPRIQKLLRKRYAQ